jgi:hypothetical protein
MPTNQPACYGGMFPDLAALEYNVAQRGKAFVAEVRSQGIGVQSAELKTDAAAWAQCIACPEYRTCYDLGMAKLMLRRALASL